MAQKKRNSPSIKRAEHLMAIQEHWFWCDRLRAQTMALQNDIPRIVADAKGSPLSFTYSGFATNYFMWLGMLFVVCQAVEQNNYVLPPELQGEITSYYKDLEKFRNSIFHIRPKFRSREFLALAKRPDFLPTMNRIHCGLGDWFNGELEKVIVESGCDPRVAVFVAALSRAETLDPDRLRYDAALLKTVAKRPTTSLTKNEKKKHN